MKNRSLRSRIHSFFVMHEYWGALVIFVGYIAFILITGLILRALNLPPVAGIFILTCVILLVALWPNKHRKQTHRFSAAWFTAFPKTGAEEDETISAETPPPLPQPPITREEKAELRKLGWTINDILNMTPDEARDILKE